jgi:predicted DNA-binding transcriptional regulator AlpA
LRPWPRSNSGPRALSAQRTERILGISHAHLYRLIAKGYLDARKIGNRTGITAESIERLIAALLAAQVRSAG